MSRQTMIDLLAREQKLKERGEKLDALYDSLIESPEKNSTLDTGDGRVAVGWRSLEEVEKMIYMNERALESLQRRICGGGITVTRLRRYC